MSHVALTTWDNGYEWALVAAEWFEQIGIEPLIVKLAGQDSPSDHISRQIHAHGWKLLSVSNRFTDAELRKSQLSAALDKALRQYMEGWPEFARRPVSRTLVPTLPVGTTTARNLTENEIREFLAALYGNTGDDGVR